MLYSDELFKQTVTRDKIKDIYKMYVAKKTDTLMDIPIIKVPEGLDRLDHNLFSKTLNHQADSIFKRIQRGSYHFYPLKEVPIPKDSSLTLKEAIVKDKVRILSIASIRDVITQKLLYDYLSPITEERFKELPNVSFAYRKDLNAQKAAQKVFIDLSDGYIHALDADLKGFFDTIPHENLFEQVKIFFENMPEIQMLLYRFIHVDIGYSIERGFKTKIIRKKREMGIPQGGILSGMLANVYLHQFDCWIMQTLSNKYEIRYTRYADDFIILSKNREDIIKVHEECKSFLDNVKLLLHPDHEKTKISHLISLDESIDFVGFKISSNHIAIKENNIHKFKERLGTIIKATDFNKKNALELLRYKCNFKYYGNGVKHFKCKNCGNFDKTRNWMKFFLVVTDLSQLKELDRWVYKSISYSYFKSTGNRFPKNTLKRIDFPSMELLYYKYRKELKKATEHCQCDPINKDIYATENPYKELFTIY